MDLPILPFINPGVESHKLQSKPDQRGIQKIVGVDSDRTDHIEPGEGIIQLCTFFDPSTLQDALGVDEDGIGNLALAEILEGSGVHHLALPDLMKS